MRHSRFVRLKRITERQIRAVTETAEQKAASVSAPADPSAGAAGFVDEAGVFHRYGISNVTSTGDPDGFWSAPG